MANSASKPISVPSSKRVKGKRKLIVDYSKDMLTIEKLVRKEEGSSKKRRLAEVTSECVSPIRQVLAEVSNQMQDDACELSEMFHKQMTLEQPTPGSDF
jgi:hypothetical protein